MKLFTAFWNNKHKLSTSLIVWCLCFSGSVLAEDLCMYLPGSWFGQYTFISHKDCRNNHGCTHLVGADITYLQGDQFQIDLRLKLGPDGLYNFSCKDSVIFSPDKPNSHIELLCANGACLVKYMDDKITAAIMRVVT